MLGNSKVFSENDLFSQIILLSGNPDDINSFVLISDFCPNEEQEYLEIFARGQDSGFGLASFIFADQPESTIFLHCEVNFCLMQ